MIFPCGKSGFLFVRVEMGIGVPSARNPVFNAERLPSFDVTSVYGNFCIPISLVGRQATDALEIPALMSIHVEEEGKCQARSFTRVRKWQKMACAKMSNPFQAVC